VRFSFNSFSGFTHNKVAMFRWTYRFSSRHPIYAPVGALQKNIYTHEQKMLSFASPEEIIIKDCNFEIFHQRRLNNKCFLGRRWDLLRSSSGTWCFPDPSHPSFASRWPNKLQVIQPADPPPQTKPDATTSARAEHRLYCLIIEKDFVYRLLGRVSAENPRTSIIHQRCRLLRFFARVFLITWRRRLISRVAEPDMCSQ